MNPIAQIIFDVLASGRGINLPEVGALSVERDAARFVSRSEVRPPHNKVVFSPGENPDFQSIIDVMAADGEDRKEAQSRYADWLAKAKTNRKMIEISEVGVLKNDVFYPSAKLHDTLNPGNAGTVRLSGNRGSGRMAAIIILGILIVCAVVFLVFALNRYLTTRNAAKTTAATEQVYTTEGESTHRGAVAPEDTIAGEPEDYASGHEAVADAGTAVGTDTSVQGDKEAVSVDNGNANVVADAPAKGGCKVCTWFRGMFGKKEKAPVVAAVVESAAETPDSSAAEVAGAEAGKTGESGKEVTAVNKACPIYHVVVGVFANPSNADKIIAEDPMNIGCRAYNKLPFKGMTMVAAFSSNSKPLADAKRRQFARYDNEVWIYTEE